MTTSCNKPASQLSMPLRPPVGRPRWVAQNFCLKPVRERALRPMQNSQDAVPDPTINGQQTGMSEPMETERTEGSSGSTESRRPPQQYTGAARVEILRKLKREVVRFRTFQNWQSIAIQPTVLAKAGFFYFNDQDKVQCAFCLGIIGQWDPTDEPLAEHRRHFPRCPFVLGLPVGNVPIDAATGRERALPPPGQINGGFDVTGTRAQIRFNGEPERGYPPSNVHVNPGSRYEDLCVERHSLPAMAAFITLDSRLKTFQTWPRGLSQKPKALAEAGLYYTGVSDEVKCFHCDGGLKGFEPNDDPWVEHAKWYPHCRHVVLLKGKDFIEDVRKKNACTMSVVARTARTEELMHMEPAISALNMGLEERDVRKAIMDQLEKYGRMFTDLNSLVDASCALARARSDEVENVNNAPQMEERSVDSGFGCISTSSNPSGSLEVAGAEVSVSMEASSASGWDSVIEPSVAEAKRVLKEEDMGDLLCKICMENKVAIVILPCAHLCTCADCASSLRNCPICRRPFKGYVRAFLS